MKTPSIETRGRTLDHAAGLYDIVEPLVLLGKQQLFNRRVVELLQPLPSDKILDVGCGTGMITAQVGEKLSADAGGMAVGIDAAGEMIDAARNRRQTPVCRFEAAAAENLPFPDQSFDAAISTLFFHHVDKVLKAKALNELNRVLVPGGRLVIADMHTPSTAFGRLISHASRWLLCQPEIGENIDGVLPPLIEQAGFAQPQLVEMYFGYIAVFTTHKEKQLP